MADILIVAAVVIILCAAVGYVYAAKKKGAKCIGCPASGSCSGRCAGCSGGGSPKE